MSRPGVKSVKKRGNSSPAEKDIENGILEYLSYLPDGFFWKNQSVGIYDPVKQLYRKSKNPYHLNGVSDILGIYNGKFIAIEVKTLKGRPTEAQKLYIKMVNDNGGFAGIARSIDEAKEILQRARSQ